MDASAWLTLDSPDSRLEARRLEAESPASLARSAAAGSGGAGRRRAGSARQAVVAGVPGGLLAFESTGYVVECAVDGVEGA
jgi:hypothetical protein